LQLGLFTLWLVIVEVNSWLGQVTLNGCKLRNLNLTLSEKSAISERIAIKIKKLLEQHSGEDEVISKVKSTDYSEVN
jgi:hypothetical protein